MKLKELADKLGARLDPPDADAEVSSVGSIESAIPGQITFAVSSKFLPLARASKASALIVDEKFPALDKPTLRTKNPQFAYARAVNFFTRCRKRNVAFTRRQSLILQPASARMHLSARAW